MYNTQSGQTKPIYYNNQEGKDLVTLRPVELKQEPTETKSGQETVVQNNMRGGKKPRFECMDPDSSDSEAEGGASPDPQVVHLANLLLLKRIRAIGFLCPRRYSDNA